MLHQLAMRQSVQAAHKEKDKAFESTHAEIFLYVYVMLHPDRNLRKKMLFLSEPKFMRQDFILC